MPELVLVLLFMAFYYYGKYKGREQAMENLNDKKEVQNSFNPTIKMFLELIEREPDN